MNTASQHGPGQYIVKEGTPYRKRLEETTDKEIAASLNNYTPLHP